MLKSLVGFIQDLQKIDSDLIDDQAIAEIAENMGRGYSDFEVADYRFIAADEIDSFLQDDLLSDLYILGCFNADFLAGIDGFPLDSDDILTMQGARAYAALGKIASKYISEIVEEYVRWDGYGHHFGLYDGGEYDIQADGKDWYVFRVN